MRGDVQETCSTMSMRTSFGTDDEMADNDSSDASGPLPCCAGPSGEHGGCRSVTKGFLMNDFSIVVLGQKILLVTSVRFLSLPGMLLLSVLTLSRWEVWPRSSSCRCVW